MSLGLGRVTLTCLVALQNGNNSPSSEVCRPFLGGLWKLPDGRSLQRQGEHWWPRSQESHRPCAGHLLCDLGKPCSSSAFPGALLRIDSTAKGRDAAQGAELSPGMQEAPDPTPVPNKIGTVLCGCDRSTGRQRQEDQDLKVTVGSEQGRRHSADCCHRVIVVTFCCSACFPGKGKGTTITAKVACVPPMSSLRPSFSEDGLETVSSTTWSWQPLVSLEMGMARALLVHRSPR